MLYIKLKNPRKKIFRVVSASQPLRHGFRNPRAPTACGVCKQYHAYRAIIGFAIASTAFSFATKSSSSAPGFESSHWAQKNGSRKKCKHADHVGLERRFDPTLTPIAWLRASPLTDNVHVTRVLLEWVCRKNKKAVSKRCVKAIVPLCVQNERPPKGGYRRRLACNVCDPLVHTSKIYP